MEHSYLTNCKLGILNRLLYNRPEKGLLYVDLPSDLPKFDTNTKIYYFRHITRPSPESLRLVYEHEEIVYYLELWHWSGSDWSLDSIKKELLAKKQNREIYKSIVEEAIKLYEGDDNRRSNYFYLEVKLMKQCNLEMITKDSLASRITPDYELGSFDEDEFQRFTGKTIEETITLDTKYTNLDFSGIFDNNLDPEEYNSEEFQCNITNFDSEKCDTFDALKIHKFLYQQYQGSKRGWYGYKDYTFDNYLVIVKGSCDNSKNNRKDDKYMLVHYCVDDASCAGWHFTLNTRVYNSFRELWSELNNQHKSAIIRAYH
ncbi:Hypothetical protein HVR_LOCUS831 [uncultured virus]|nr:Hypothetical protein HVR_LOCUS831 [uncultured virus]